MLLKVKLENKDDLDEDVKTRGALGLHNSERQISLMTFPDGSYGSAGYDKYIEDLSKEGQKGRKTVGSGEDKSRRLMDYIQKFAPKDPNDDLDLSLEENNRTASLDFVNYIHPLKFISVVYYNIIKNLLTNYDTTNVWYVPMSFVTGSGAIAFGICLKSYYFSQFTGRRSPFIKNDDGDLIINLKKTPRFAIIRGNMTESQINNILTLAKSYENRFGEYLKMVIVTPVGREGISIGNVSNIIVPGGYWNPSDESQAIFRAKRVLSHIYLVDRTKK